MKRFLPSLKAAIARALYEEHDMKQTDIAKWLGITQAAVSKYLSKGFANSRESAAVSKLVEKHAKSIAQHIAGGRLAKEQLAMEVCEACLNLNKNSGCGFQRSHIAGKSHRAP